ncbi:MAG: GTPase Era [Bacteroidia bacterium]|nr:GTPase Era [Bacteroidia bacterium]
MFKAGWVSVVGNANVGKSTLVNALVGEKLSIVTHKPQTTRRRITAISNGSGYQIVFADTPGVIKPRYKMQEAMMKSVGEAFQDADVLMLVTDTIETDLQPGLLDRLKKTNKPVILAFNKIDLEKQETVNKKVEVLKNLVKPKEIVPVSALHSYGIEELKKILLDYLPEGDPFFDKEQLSDMPERFFAAEIIREQIMLHYQQEIPYSAEVVVEQFKEETTTSDKDLIRIRATIYVNRQSQKAIIIGKGGSALKKTATGARINLEKWLDCKVFLEVFVKVKADWREDERQLKNFGYL